MKLPIVLLIFFPSAVHQPWAKICFGSGNPRLISIAGQYTAWNQRISLPIRWTSTGQNVWNNDVEGEAPGEPPASRRDPRDGSAGASPSTDSGYPSAVM